jgi:hypothetical protein
MVMCSSVIGSHGRASAAILYKACAEAFSDGRSVTEVSGAPPTKDTLAPTMAPSRSSSSSWRSNQQMRWP